MKFKRVNFYGGSTDFPSGSSYRYEKSCKIVTDIADALISMNIGWDVDTTRSTSTTDYTQIPPRSGSTTYPGLFLKNTVSNCKLFICYFATLCTETISLFDNNSLLNFGKVNPNYTGLMMSMIPGESTQVFGDPNTTSFLPQHATRLVGTVHYYNTSSSYNKQRTIAGYPLSGYTYTYGLWATDSVIAVGAYEAQGSTPSIFEPCYIVGKIMGTLAHSTEDNAPNAMYGVLLLKDIYSVSNINNDNTLESLFGIRSYSPYLFGNNSNTFISCPITSNIDFFSEKHIPVSSVAKSNGDYINGCNYSNCLCTFAPVDIVQSSEYVFSNQSGSIRWTPYSVFCVSSDLTTNGIISGDGFKGYVDTSLLRCAHGIHGQTYDSGNFVCCSLYNLLIGWDPNNTDTLV